MYEILLNTREVTQVTLWPRKSMVPNPYIVSCSGADLRCFYHECNADGFTVVFFHGNGEVVADFVETLPRHFEAIGCNTFLVEFRGYGGSTGEPGIGHLLADCEALLAQLPARHDRLILFGRSLGCLPALKAMSLAPGIAGIVLESGIRDLYEYIHDSLVQYFFYPFTREQEMLLESEIRLNFDIHHLVSEFRGCAVVSYSLLDLPARQTASRDLYSWIGSPKKLLVSDTADHNSLLREKLVEYCHCILAMTKGTFAGEVNSPWK